MFQLSSLLLIFVLISSTYAYMNINTKCIISNKRISNSIKLDKINNPLSLSSSTFRYNNLINLKPIIIIIFYKYD